MTAITTAPEPSGREFIYVSIPASEFRGVTGALLDVLQDYIATDDYDPEKGFYLFFLLRGLTDQIAG